MTDIPTPIKETKRAFGRKTRVYDPTIPHFSVLRMMAGPPTPIPVSHDWAKGMPDNLNELLNDSLGDCTCAGALHAQQVWTFNSSGTMDEVTDAQALWMYENWAGYVPNNPATDQGANEQEILTHWINMGFPYPEYMSDISTAMATKESHDKLSAFIEIDPRNLNDVRRAIYSCGLVYIGFEVPQSLQDDDPPVWEVVNGQTRIMGGHCIILTGYDADTFSLISWGKKYKMTTEFFSKFTDEVYALIDSDWVTSTGSTPLGLSLQTLTAQMNSLRSRQQVGLIISSDGETGDITNIITAEVVDGAVKPD